MEVQPDNVFKIKNCQYSKIAIFKMFYQADPTKQKGKKRRQAGFQIVMSGFLKKNTLVLTNKQILDCYYTDGNSLSRSEKQITLNYRDVNSVVYSITFNLVSTQKQASDFVKWMNMLMWWQPVDE